MLVGHSLGGLFVRLYAGRYPDEVAGLVLVDPSHEDQEERTRELIGPQLWATMQAQMATLVDPEGFDLTAISNQVRAARTETPLRPMPLVVLSHGRAETAGLPPGWPVEAEVELWRELHGDLAALVPNGRLVVAERSGHFIQSEQPELVVEAIRAVVAAVRNPAASVTPAAGTPTTGVSSVPAAPPAAAGTQVLPPSSYAQVGAV